MLKHHLQAFRPNADFKLEAELAFLDRGIQLRYQLTGEMQAVRFPRPEEARARDELWKETCFEFFLQAEGSRAYHEWNLSPSSAWAHYLFQDYRQRSNDMALPGPLGRIQCELSASRFELEALLPWPQDGRGVFTYGVTAVLQTEKGELSYWALHHPLTQADFHDAASFTGRGLFP